VDSSSPAYNSRLGEWDKRAGVRNKPRRVLTEQEETAGKVFFSPALAPVVGHPLIVRLGPEACYRLLIQHLYHYLDFTANFEVEVVNRGAHRIALGKAGVDLPEEMMFDALKIYCDEGYHSFFSADLKFQVMAATRVAPAVYDFKAFMRRLMEAGRAVPANLRSTSSLLIVIVFETLISSTLNKIPKDEQVVETVRQTVAETQRQRSVLGPILPHYIIKLLEPDYGAIRRRLALFDLTAEEIEQIISEAYPWSEVKAGLRKTASATLRLFERNGLFEDGRTLDAFRASGLLE
jgi:hypothetical protein